MGGFFRIDEHDVGHRIVDGEAVVINFESSVYYGLNVAATDVWNRLLAGPASAECLVSGYAAANGLDEAMAEHDLTGLLALLAEEGLVKPAVAGSESTSAFDWPQRESYVAPKVDKYEKLEQLMLSGE